MSHSFRSMLRAVSSGSPKVGQRLPSHRRRGAAAAEFAIVAPFFLLLIFGILEFGRMIMVQQLLTNASREGARLACIDGTTFTDVDTSVKAYLANASVPGASVVVTPTALTTATPGTQITVGASIPFSQVSWIGSSWFDTDVTLSSSCQMRREGIP